MCVIRVSLLKLFVLAAGCRFEPAATVTSIDIDLVTLTIHTLVDALTSLAEMLHEGPCATTGPGRGFKNKSRYSSTTPDHRRCARCRTRDTINRLPELAHKLLQRGENPFLCFFLCFYISRPVVQVVGGDRG
jgi:hypothetical protein